MPDERETRFLGSAVFPGAPAEVANARTYTRTTLAKAIGHGNPAIDDVELLVSETVTNAVLHTPSGRTGPTGAPTGTVTLTLSLAHDRIRAEITDEGAAAGLPEPRPGPCDEHGRGLWLVAAIASAWGHDRRESEATLWFEVPLPPHGLDGDPSDPAVRDTGDGVFLGPRA